MSGISLPGVTIGQSGQLSLPGVSVGLPGTAAASLANTGGSWLMPSRAPLSQVALQSGNLAPPLKAEPATGNNNSQGSQRSIVIGEVVPIVFCKRAGQDGGVVVAPGATECRFSNNSATNAIEADYHLVLGEGPMGLVQVRDVFIAGIRRGTISQSFNRRAGDWDPGNSVVAVTGKSFRLASYNCGGGETNGYGSYANLSTLSYSIVCNDGDDTWKSQVSIFVRQGITVTQLVGGGSGASNNLVDLIYYLLQKTARIPSSLIDLPSLQAAALFLQTQNFTYDGVIDASINVRDWLSQVLPYYLLKESSINGKFALRPVVPTNSDGTINTGTLTPLFVFDDTNIVAGSFEIQYIDLNERKPINLKMQWRQQEDDLWSTVRTTELRYPDTPTNIPNEQHDVSSYATRETHVVKAGIYLLAHRRYVTHTARVTVLPGAASTSLVPGNIVQLLLTRNASTGSWGQHNQLYSVETIRKAATGEVTLELLQIPLDGSQRSLIAIDVQNATGSGMRVVPNITSPPDVNSKTDTTTPPDTAKSRKPITPGTYTPTGGTPVPPAPGNPTPDPLGEPIKINLPYGRAPADGETISVPDVCVNQRTQWLRGRYIGPNGYIDWEAITGAIGPNYVVTGAIDAGTNLTAVFTCDGSTPTPTNGTILKPTVPGNTPPTNPYDPLPPYSVNIQELTQYLDDCYNPTGEPQYGARYTSYGPYGIDVSYIPAGSYNPGASAVIMWITDASGNKHYTFGYEQGWRYKDDNCNPLPVDQIYPLPPVCKWVRA